MGYHINIQMNKGLNLTKTVMVYLKYTPATQTNISLDTQIVTSKHLYTENIVHLMKEYAIPPVFFHCF